MLTLISALFDDVGGFEGCGFLGTKLLSKQSKNLNYHKN